MTGLACSASPPTVNSPPSRSGVRWSTFRVHKIRLIGASTSHRGKGGAVAHECLEQTLAMLATQTPGERALGLIDHRNLPSKRLVSSLGFVEVNLPGIDPDLGAWVIDLPDRPRQ